MTHLRLVNTIRRDFFQNWVAYTALILGINVVIGIVLIPLLSWLTSAVLDLGGIDYVSYTNATSILLHHPFTCLGLLLILILSLLLVYWQFSILMLGIYDIKAKRGFSIRTIIRDTMSLTPKLSLSSFGFFLGYFVLILPFAGIGFKTALLAKVKIPDFIMAFILTKIWLLGLLIIAYLIVLYLGLRLLFVLPNLTIRQQPVHQAISDSWQKTRHRTGFYFLNILMLSLAITVFGLICYVLIIAEQGIVDNKLYPAAFAIAVLNMVLIQIVAQFVLIFSTFGLMRILMADIIVPRIEQPVFVHKRRRPRILTIGAVLVVAVGVVGFNVIYLQGLTVTRPLEISHRGVDNGNGVQNTIPALHKTSKEHPDYVEMDIHETKDHKFVVMHDENLKHLTGINAAPYQMNLNDITTLTARENGYAARVPSFDRYLSAAEKYHQKLLVEIKTTSHDSPDMLDLFIKRYATRLRRDHDEIHSLSYSVIKGLKQKDPKQFVSFILPYNFSFPHTKANAYTMEYTTLTDSFIDEANARHQRVYAWTVNTDNAMQSALFQGANGIITDNLSLLKTTVNDNLNHPTYTTRLIDYVVDVPSTNMPLN